MEQPKQKPVIKWISVLLIPVSIAGLLANHQEYNQIREGTAVWKSKSPEPWYYHNPDGFFVYMIIESIILVAISCFAISNLATKKEKYWEIAMTLYILVRLTRIINEFIKG